MRRTVDYAGRWKATIRPEGYAVVVTVSLARPPGLFPPLRPCLLETKTVRDCGPAL